MTCALVSLVCLWLTSAARATIVDANDEWGIVLYSDESLTAIAHYVWGSVEFTAVPVWTTTIEFDYVNAGWSTALSPDNKIAYMYGPTINGGPDPELFSYNLFYQWDPCAPDFEPDYPVYIDTAVFDGPFGSPPTNYWGVRFTPGDPDPSSREYREEPYYKDEPGYEEGFYDNPIPEPMTICLLGLGTVLLRKKRKRKALSLYKLQ